MDTSPPAKRQRRALNAWQAAWRRELRVLRQLWETWCGNWVITWAKEDMMADNNRHFEHKYFTIRERVALGEIALYWLPGKLNPDDVTTKALDKAVTVAHAGVISGQSPLPIPKGCKVWHGPIDKPREIVGG